jgi:hypothetical protein
LSKKCRQRIHWTCQHRLKASLEPRGNETKEEKNKKKERTRIKREKETWKWTTNLTAYGYLEKLHDTIIAGEERQKLNKKRKRLIALGSSSSTRALLCSWETP